MALYQQVKDHVMRKIADGSLSAGERVPSEQELVQEFGVARMTANRALRELAEQGVIVRVAGVGSFVAEEKPQSTLLRIANIAEEIRQRGHDHRFELISVRRESASPEAAASLQLSAGSSVFHLQGVHFENDVPVQLEDRHVNPRMAPDFMEQDFADPAFGVPGAQRALRPDRACGGRHAAHARAGTLAADGDRPALPDADAPHLVPGHARDLGALRASGHALPAGQPLSHRRRIARRLRPERRGSRSCAVPLRLILYRQA